MSLPPYRHYRPSGVAWMGHVPAEWRVAPIGYLGGAGMGQTILREDVLPEPAEGALPVYSASEGEQVFGFLRDPQVVLEPGDIVIGARGSIGFARKIQDRATCTQTTIWFKPNPREIQPSFLYWVMSGCREHLFPFDKTAVPMLTVSQVRAGRIPVPPADQQRTIANFLDHETAKIDTLLAEQERLIALLQEKRQAVISHAVTKGLDPNVPMKDSGAEWIGTIPAHWKVMRVRDDASHLTSGPRGWSELFVDEGDPFIRITNVQRDSLALDLSDLKRVSAPAGPEADRTRVAPGDVLFSITADTGSVGLVPQSLGKAYISQHLCLVRLRQNYFDPHWVGIVALSNVGKSYFDAQKYGGTKVQLSLEDVANFTVPCPPLAEQRTIADWIDTAAGRAAEAQAQAERCISLLRERRTALITAAVTGQIDVRGLVETAA